MPDTSASDRNSTGLVRWQQILFGVRKYLDWFATVRSPPEIPMEMEGGLRTYSFKNTMVQFGYCILYVSDVSRAIGFYERAFGFHRKFITPENDYGELATGQTTLAFVSKELAHSNLRNGFQESDPAHKPFAMELGLVTDRVAETVKRALQEGATVVEEPKQKPWGQTVAYLRDPEGFLIEICTPIAM